jgi:hypothetical protein
MTALVYILLGWGITIGAALSLGILILRQFRLYRLDWESTLLGFYAGSAGLSLLVFTLAAAGLIYKPIVYSLGLGLIFAVRPRLPRIPWHWSALTFLPLTTLYLTHALAPEHSPDGMSYHLGLVARYYRAHGFEKVPTNLYAFLSQGIEMLFLFAYAIGRHSAAALVHFTFLLSLPALLAIAGGRTGWFAGLFVFALPVVGIDGISAYNDVALAAVVFAVWLCMDRWYTTQAAVWVSLAALLAGFAFAIKFTGIIALLFLLPAWRLWPAWSLAVLSMAPWLLRSLHWSGNPLAPFFNDWFPNPYFNVEFEQQYRAFLHHYDLPGPSAWFREIILGGPHLSGTFGPLALALPLALLAARSHPRLLLGAAIALSTYPLNIGIRFLIPALPFLSLAVCSALPRLALPLALSAAFLAWPFVIPFYSSPHTWFLKDFPWRAAIWLESEDGFLTRKSAGYITARLIEQMIPPGESVFALSPIPESYTSRNILIGYQSTLGQQLSQALAAPTYEGYQASQVFSCPTGDITVERDSTDTFSISEIEPLPESIHCSRHPWDAPLAIDRNPATRWRTWAPARAGDHCTLSPSQPYRLSITPDQWNLQLQGCQRQFLSSPADYRESARRFFLSRQVRYLAIDSPDYPSRDLRENPHLWPLDLLAERGTMRLYRWR